MRAVVLCGLLACGGARGARKLEGRYDVGTPGEGWRRVRPGGADLAWHHPGLGGAIYADSNCAERFEDDTLPALAEALSFGVRQGEPIRQEALSLDGRDAWLVVSEGGLDGVPIRLGTVVVKKDFCTYDLVYFAPPDRFESGWPAFAGVLAGFRTRR